MQHFEAEQYGHPPPPELRRVLTSLESRRRIQTFRIDHELVEGDLCLVLSCRGLARSVLRLSSVALVQLSKAC